MTNNQDDWMSRALKLEAENKRLIAELVAARAQNEHMLATIRSLYEAIRDEQTARGERDV